MRTRACNAGWLNWLGMVGALPATLAICSFTSSEHERSLEKPCFEKLGAHVEAMSSNVAVFEETLVGLGLEGEERYTRMRSEANNSHGVAALGVARFQPGEDPPSSPFRTWGHNVCFNCPRDVCQQTMPSGFVMCLNCRAAIIVRGRLSSQLGALVSAVRAFEDPADIITQPPMDLELALFEDVDVVAKEAEVSEAVIAFISVTTKTGQEAKAAAGAPNQK